MTENRGNGTVDRDFFSDQPGSEVGKPFDLVYVCASVYRCICMEVYVCASVYRCICMEVYMYVRVFRSGYVCASV